MEFLLFCWSLKTKMLIIWIAMNNTVIFNITVTIYWKNPFGFST